MTSKGGLAILRAPMWVPLVSSVDSLYKDHTMCVILKDLLNGDLGFLNIYVPNEYQN